jgi:signal transduction histidine kinase
MDVTYEGRIICADSARRLREAQIGLLYEFPARLIGHLVNAALIVAVFWPVMDHLILAGWGILFTFVLIGRYILYLAYCRRKPGDDPLKWAWRFVISSTLTSILWGVTTVTVWFVPGVAYHAFIAFVLAGTCPAATAMLYPFLPALYLFLLTAAAPLIVSLLLVGDGVNQVMGAMTAVLTILFVIQGQVTHATFFKSLILQEENRELVDDLSVARDNLEVRVQERTQALDQANETLRAEIAARAETESRLRQAHKMEAIGQLTGGVSHDFNNLLAVIQGNAELLSESVKDEAQKREVQAVLRASARGAQLTQRLLAFSRKQTLQPQPVNVNELVTSMTNMLDRTLGTDVEINFCPNRKSSPLWLIPVSSKMRFLIWPSTPGMRWRMAGGSLFPRAPDIYRGMSRA